MAGDAASDTEGERSPPSILVIGDSYMFGGFGKRLDEQLRTLSKDGDTVWTHSSCGSSPLTWLEGVPTPCGVWDRLPQRDGIFQAGTMPTPKISKLLDKYHPDVTVVALGINFIRFQERAPGDLRRFLGELERVKTRCIWVGPPKSGKFSDEAVQKANDLIRREAGQQCDLVWSSELTSYPKWNYMDGVHYDPIAARKWADKVFAAIKNILQPPAQVAPSPMGSSASDAAAVP